MSAYDMSAYKRRRLRGAGGRAGFTMIELTVSLMAGLIVAMGVLMLSREAASTFHEESRVSAAEATLRTAMDRLRADLQRAGYMSTGNIWADPTIAVPPGGTISNVYPNPTKVAGLMGLASVTLSQGGSRTTNGLAQSGLQPTALKPDLIQVAGNMTGTDQFEVLMVTPPSATACDRIDLIPNSPAMRRVSVGDAGATGAELAGLFVPSTAAGNKPQFIVRLVDDFGCSQYLATCAEATPVGIDATTGNPFVDVDATNTPILQSSQTGGHCGISSFGTARSWINPVQIVKWEITDSAGTGGDLEPAAALAALGSSAGDAGTSTGPKYDLMRTYYDVNDQPVADTKEIVAEFAVDLSFAFTVDKGTAALPNITTFAFDDATDNGGTWTQQPGAGNPLSLTGPQRIRSIRVRLVTREAQADRPADIVPPALGASTENFLYRYCVAADCPTPATGELAWARARTMTTEVSLPNQARSFY